MTPCEEKGYKVGDRFEVVKGNLFSFGSVVEIIEDDGTDLPRLMLISGACSHDMDYLYEDMSCLRKIVIEESGQPKTITLDGKEYKLVPVEEEVEAVEVPMPEVKDMGSFYAITIGGFYVLNIGKNGKILRIRNCGILNKYGIKTDDQGRVVIEE